MASVLRRWTGRAQERLPEPVVRAAKEAALGAGWLTADARLLPSFLVVGAQRCGTTTMYRLLGDHPQVVRPTTSKGIGYFDLHHDRSLRWYRGHFPLAGPARRRAGSGAVTFESSGYYCFHPLAPARIAAALPGVRLVMLVRDPAERAFSAWKHERARGFEHEEFERALALEGERLQGEEERMVADPTYLSFNHRHHAYVRRGEYVTQLRRLHDAVGAERVRVVDADAFFADPVEEFAALCRWLGLDEWRPASVEQWNARPSAPLDPGARTRLLEHFAPFDEQLGEMTGATPSWRR